MAKIYEVLELLCPDAEYVCRGNNYKDIDWLGKNAAITENAFTEGLKTFANLQLEQIAAKKSARAAILNRLGITADEAAILFS